jgi:preprotein translocase subunit SecD
MIMRKKARLMIISILTIMAIGFCTLWIGCTTFSTAEGVRIKLRVVTDDAIAEELITDAYRIDLQLHSKGVSFASVKRRNAAIEITGVDSARDNDVQALINHLYLSKYEVRKAVLGKNASYVLSLLPDYASQIRQSAVKQTMETISRRLDELHSGIYHKAKLYINNVDAKEVSDCLIIEAPSMEDWRRVNGLLEEPAHLEFCLVKNENSGPFTSIEKAMASNGGNINLDKFHILPYQNRAGLQQYMVVNKIPVITKMDVKTARRRTDRNGAPAVNFSLTSDGAILLGDVTENHVGEKLAIILHDTIYTAFVIHNKIESEGMISEGILEGPFTVQQAEDLALLLSTDRFLPVSVLVLEEKSIQSK